MRSRTVWLIVAACVVPLVVLATLPIGILLIWGFPGPDIDGPRSAADRFVRHLERNDDVAAHRSLCPELRESITVPEFTAAVERLGRPISHALGKAGFSDEAGGSASVTVHLTGRTGRTTDVHLYLTGGSGWRVCDDMFG
ncbi:hypothetical protein [Micromonospora orduensis]|uniref:hypothetical protein n=1 Tax=Micromonospora orduensis TaxID=1420891 RepID=UPI0036398929